jgi:5-methyltetrahydropteroyltriglutamate--homocysteine methyltransferase
MNGDHEYGVLFPASVVGSMPRPDHVRKLICGDASLSPEEYEAHMDRAVREVVALQEHAGLDVITDGEWRRKSYIGVIAELAHGFELSRHPEDGRPWTVVVDRLAPKHPGFIAREVKFLKAITDRMVKATLPSPGLLGERMWDPAKSAAAYPSREDFVRACVSILRKEIELLRKEGATIVQIDDPHLCLFVDDEVRAQYEDPDSALEFAVDMTNELVDGFADVKLAVHLCRRAGARVRGEVQHAGSFERIVGQLNRLNVHHLTLEFTAPGSGDVSVLRQLRGDLEIGLGCVNCQPGIVDSPAIIVERVESALRYVDAGRITLNPDCGFAPGSGAIVPMDEVFQKLQNEVEAAGRLRAICG